MLDPIGLRYRIDCGGRVAVRAEGSTILLCEGVGIVSLYNWESPVLSAASSLGQRFLVIQGLNLVH